MTRKLFAGIAFYAVLIAFASVGLFSSVEPTKDMLSWSLLGEVDAQSSRRDRSRKKDEKERSIPNMTESTYNKLAEVTELIDEENNPQAAIEVLENMIKRGTRRYNGNEIANIYRMFAYAYFILDDFEQTIFYNEKLLEHREDIRIGMETTTMFALAQLYFQADRYDESLAMIEAWLELIEDPGPRPYFFVATIYYQQKQFENAIEYVKLAIDMATERDMLPINKSWWAMLRSLYWETKNYAKVIEVLEIMVKEYPERDSWIQLAGMYGQEDMPKKQLYAMESANVLGFFERETDYLQYQSVLMAAEVPIRGAWYLQEGFDNGLVEESFKSLNALGQSYQASLEDEDAIERFEDATEFAEDGKIYKRLAQLYLGKEEYEKCSKRADEAIDKGGVDRLHDLKILKGMCEFNLENLSKAREIFIEARKLARQAEAKSAEKSARDWIRYIESEQKRLRQLAAAERT